MEITKALIAEMELRLIEAIKKSDLPFLDKTLHDDLLAMAPNGQTITKAMDLASHRAGEMVVENLVPAIGDINIIGDTAVSIIIYDTKGTMLGNPIAGKFKYIRVWKKFDDGLKVIAASWLKI